MPSLVDCDDMYIMPSTPLTCSSIGAADRIAHGLGVGAGVERRYQDRGRSHFGILRHRQREHGDTAGQHEYDRQHGGEYRSVYEEV